MAGWTHSELTDTESMGTGCSSPGFLQQGRKSIPLLLSKNYIAGSEPARKVKAGLDENHFHVVGLFTLVGLHTHNSTGLIVTAATAEDHGKHRLNR